MIIWSVNLGCNKNRFTHAILCIAGGPCYSQFFILFTCFFNSYRINYKTVVTIYNINLDFSNGFIIGNAVILVIRYDFFESVFISFRLSICERSEWKTTRVACILIRSVCQRCIDTVTTQFKTKLLICKTTTFKHLWSIQGKCRRLQFTCRDIICFVLHHDIYRHDRIYSYQVLEWLWWLGSVYGLTIPYKELKMIAIGNDHCGCSILIMSQSPEPIISLWHRAFGIVAVTTACTLGITFHDIVNDTLGSLVEVAVSVRKIRKWFPVVFHIFGYTCDIKWISGKYYFFKFLYSVLRLFRRDISTVKKRASASVRIIKIDYLIVKIWIIITTFNIQGSILVDTVCQKFFTVLLNSNRISEFWFCSCFSILLTKNITWKLRGPGHYLKLYIICFLISCRRIHLM